MPPRDPLRQTLARREDGQREAWIITPGRLPRFPSHNPRGAPGNEASAASNQSETYAEPEKPVNKGKGPLCLRGGADSEAESFSQWDDGPYPPNPVRPDSPWPPFLEHSDYRRATEFCHYSRPFHFERGTAVSDIPLREMGSGSHCNASSARTLHPSIRARSQSLGHGYSSETLWNSSSRSVSTGLSKPPIKIPQPLRSSDSLSQPLPVAAPIGGKKRRSSFFEERFELDGPEL